MSRHQLSAYFQDEAKAWEALTYLKLRYVAGDGEVADRALQAVQAGISEMAKRPAFDAELAEVRDRLERSEGAQNLKTGPGGIYDLDYLAGRCRRDSSFGWRGICASDCSRCAITDC